MKRITISVLVSSYNYQDYVIDSVNSALNQSYQPLEVVIVDDESKDDSVARLKSTFGHLANVKIIAKPNGGQMSTWVEGLPHLRGDVVALLDSDDLWAPNYLERIAAVYTQNPSVDYVFTNMKNFGARTGLILKKRRHRNDRDLGLSVLMGSYFNRWQGAPTSANSLRRSLFEQVLSLPSEQQAEWTSFPDTCLCGGSDVLGAHKYFVSEPLVMHREHERNAFLTYSQSAIKQARFVMRIQKALAYYRAKAGVTTHWLELAKHEFRTKPRPVISEMLIYCGLAMRAPTNWSARLNNLAAIVAHYFKSIF